MSEKTPAESAKELVAKQRHEVITNELVILMKKKEDLEDQLENVTGKLSELETESGQKKFFKNYLSQKRSDGWCTNRISIASAIPVSGSY